MISESLSGVFGVLNTIPGVSVPRKPEQLAARVAFLRTLMEITIRIYKCSPASGRRVTEARSFLAVLFVATMRQGSVCPERRDFR
jgi:hypothetical protein